jgi:hypothetical protein
MPTEDPNYHHSAARLMLFMVSVLLTSEHDLLLPGVVRTAVSTLFDCVCLCHNKQILEHILLLFHIWRTSVCTI